MAQRVGGVEFRGAAVVGQLDLWRVMDVRGSSLPEQEGGVPLGLRSLANSWSCGAGGGGGRGGQRGVEEGEKGNDEKGKHRGYLCSKGPKWVMPEITNRDS